MTAPETPCAKRCPACGCPAIVVDLTLPADIVTCAACDGLLARNLSRPSALRVVALDEPMQAETDDGRYFDFVIEGRRVHGWFDRHTRRVVQYG